MCVCARVCVCVRACVCVCARVCVYVSECVRAWVRVCVHACISASTVYINNHILYIKLRYVDQINENTDSEVLFLIHCLANAEPRVKLACLDSK